MTTDPTITLPASDLRETVAYLVFRAVCVGDEDRAAALAVADQILTEVAKAAAREDVPALVAEVRRVRTELATARATDPAPATPPEPIRTYELPAEPPPGTTALWDVEGVRWERQHPQVDRWVADETAVFESVRTWSGLLARGPLSTTPPAGAEGER